jgi:glycosyltransferase involved in cell wall biosynthesis
MPFDRSGIWTIPEENDHIEFKRRVFTKSNEIAPTPEMLKAITAKFQAKESPLRQDVFNTIGKLKGAVDIVMPVYDGLHVLKPCIESIIARTNWNYRLIIVDDASPDPAIEMYLNELMADCGTEADITVLRNKRNQGFAPTVNRGVAEGTNPYVCIINTDTVVTEGWLVRQLMALEADEKNVITTPATNNTALVQVPMYNGCSYLDMADAIASAPNTLTYNEIMPTGFCFTMHRKLWDDVGPFDEAYVSYGEEALSLNTIVPTPKGKQTVGTITVGDEVFTVDGTSTRVIKTTEVFQERPCYEVEFDSGISVVADEGHNWTTLRGTKRTAELEVGMRVPLCLPVQYSEKELLVDPYLLGVWLGDGHTHHARVTTTDPEIRQAFVDAEYKVSEYDNLTFAIGSNDGSKGPIQGAGIYGSLPNLATFQSQLKSLSLIGNKRIPRTYLQSNVAQRSALLQGLMDTDGYCSHEGRCVLSTSNTNLLSDYLELIRGLGIKASVTKSIKNNHRIHLRANGLFNLFRLQRKLERVKLPVRENAKSHRIIKINKTHSQPVRCIAVDHPSHTFLIDEYLPTHNTDFWFKAIKQTDKNGVILRNRSVIADNAYVFHERGTSFSQLDSGEHMGLRRSGSERFHKLHPDFASWRQGFNAERAVQHLRSELPMDAFKKQYKGNIAWVVKSAGNCGGMAFITDIVNQLIEEGYNAKVCVVPNVENDGTSPPDMQVMGNLRTSPIFFTSHEEFVATFTERVFSRGKVFSAVTELSPVVWDLDQAYKRIEGYNHVQSYDVELCTLGGLPELAEGVLKSYQKLSNIVSSRWIAETLLDQGCEVSGVILPGVNPNLFHPRDRTLGDERFTVALLINTQYNFKGAAWCSKFLEALAPEKHPHIRVLAIGPEAIKDVRGVTCLGNVPQAKLASLLGTEVDIFVDPSQVHSYGLPALEALYSGCGVITRENKGIHEYSEVWNDRVLVTENPVEAAELILSCPDFHAAGPVCTNPNTNRHENVRKFIDFVFPKIITKSRRIEVVTPHLRKHGGPTTIISAAQQLRHLGNKVSMSVVHPDWNPEVLNMAGTFNVRTNWDEIDDEVEVVILNSDNPAAETLMNKYPNKKFIMLKLSHNPRFKALEDGNLKLPWAHIMTSTEWLRRACLTPMKGWEHPAWGKKKVTTVGWYHYGHPNFNMPPTNRPYGNADVGFRVGTLIHSHPSKGTVEAMGVIDAFKRKYEAKFRPVGFGELRANTPDYMQYFQNADRAEMSRVFKYLDIWFGASHTEGLGRLALEAMSAGVAVVTTDTGAEFLKHGENCLLYPVGDMQAAADMIDKLANDTAYFSQIVVSGHNTASAAADPIPFRNNMNAVIAEVLK